MVGLLAPSPPPRGAIGCSHCLHISVADKLYDLVYKALVNKGEQNAAEVAKQTVDSVMNHPIVVIQGTDQLRAFGDRANYLEVLGRGNIELDDGPFNKVVCARP